MCPYSGWWHHFVESIHKVDKAEFNIPEMPYFYFKLQPAFPVSTTINSSYPNPCFQIKHIIRLYLLTIAVALTLTMLKRALEKWHPCSFFFASGTEWKPEMLLWCSKCEEKDFLLHISLHSGVSYVSFKMMKHCTV